MTVRLALQDATARLAEASVLVPRLTAEVLLAFVLGRDRVFLLAHAADDLDAAAHLRFVELVTRRLQETPTQHLTGVQEFYGREFQVSADVLIPRPETEHLVEAVLPLSGIYVDVGAGSGAIAVTISLEKQQQVFAVELSASALAIARRNAETLKANVQFVRGDLLSAFGAQSIDVVVSNPPYISEAEEPELQREVREHEPRLALIGGPLGTEVYDRLVSEAEVVLKLGGWLALELGHQSAPFLRTRLGAGWTDVAFLDDYSGIQRVCLARWRGLG